MANTPTGPYPPVAGGYSALVAQKLKQRPYAALFPEVFGAAAFSSATDADIYAFATQAIAAFEASAEVCQFSSKYDASIHGVPQMHKYTLTPSEENGRKLFFGAAQCSQCHSTATLHSGQNPRSKSLPQPIFNAGGKDLFTMYCYANVGVPKNPNNPFYQQTDAASNPYGANTLGEAFVDYGIGMNPNPAPDGTRFMIASPGDVPQFRGLFKAPTLRNADMRINAAFVKSYMHNGVFKSLKEVVHFYNERNIALDAHGNKMAFDLRVGPPPGFTAEFPPPEVMDNMQNIAGLSPANAGADVATNGQVGNLGLTYAEEDDLVHFLQILTDGFTRPNPVVQP
jgi:cytochrome c peroxidase